jgi:hypothetical protein
MSRVEQNYTLGNQEMLAIVMSCRHWRHYFESAMPPVDVLTDHYNLRRFITTKSLTSRRACWWEMLSNYNFNIVYRAGKKNLADAPSCPPDYARVPEGCCITTILTARCNATFCLRQLYPAAVHEDEVFEDVHPDTFTDLIQQGQVEDHIAIEDCTALGLPRGYQAEEHSVSAMVLR